jgi:hypothetical protein
MRETSSIVGLPIAGSIGSLKCGVPVLELSTDRIFAMIIFMSQSRPGLRPENVLISS